MPSNLLVFSPNPVGDHCPTESPAADATRIEGIGNRGGEARWAPHIKTQAGPGRAGRLSRRILGGRRHLTAEAGDGPWPASSDPSGNASRMGVAGSRRGATDEPLWAETQRM